MQTFYGKNYGAVSPKVSSLTIDSGEETNIAYFTGIKFYSNYTKLQHHHTTPISKIFIDEINTEAWNEGSEIRILNSWQKNNPTFNLTGVSDWGVSTLVLIDRTSTYNPNNSTIRNIVLTKGTATTTFNISELGFPSVTMPTDYDPKFYYDGTNWIQF